jgi:5-methylcytosine-specific restriction protein A
MRRSTATNTLVLVSNHTKSLYDDVWIGDTFHYTGMGTIGDQSLNFMQNKTLHKSRSNGVDVFLFEVFIPKEYTFIGQVDLVGEPYKAKQPDDQGDVRDVWMFPMEVRGGRPPIAVPASLLEKEQARRERYSRSLSNDELRQRAMLSQGTPGSREALTTSFQRNPDVAMWAKRRANGICQLCGNPAPFVDKSGEPFLESHHIIWLSQGGRDTIENTVAICPNCHRKMHLLNKPEDVRVLTTKARHTA